MIDPHIPQSTRRDGNAHHYDYEPTSPHFIEPGLRLATEWDRIESVSI